MQDGCVSTYATEVTEICSLFVPIHPITAAIVVPSERRLLRSAGCKNDNLKTEDASPCRVFREIRGNR